MKVGVWVEGCGYRILCVGKLVFGCGPVDWCGDVGIWVLVYGCGCRGVGVGV